MRASRTRWSASSPAATSTCSAPTPISTRSRCSATTCPARPSRSSPRAATRAGPIFQGQEIGIKLSHWAPAGNEADLESADFIDYFSGLESTGRRRLLHRGVQERAHAPAGGRRRRPAQGADRGGQGRPDRRGHVHGQGPHGPPDRVRRRRLRRLPPVRGAAGRRARPAARGLGRAGPDQAAVARNRQAPDAGVPAGASASIRSPVGRAPTWRTWSRRPVSSSPR